MTGAKLNKTHTEFVFLRSLPDERRKSPCSKIAAPKPVAPPLAGFKTGAEAGRYGGGIIIAPEYKPAGAVCRSLYAPGARHSPPSLREAPSLRDRGGKSLAVGDPSTLRYPATLRYAGQAPDKSAVSTQRKGDQIIYPCRFMLNNL